MLNQDHNHSDASALQTTVCVTTGANDSAVTAPTTGAVDGSIIYVRKADSGAGKIVINTGASIPNDSK